MDAELERRLGLAREEVAKRLSTIFKAWTVEGDVVMGPGTLAVRVEDHHQVGPTHFDVGFVLNRNNRDAPVLWDCAAGLGATEHDVIERAVETWARSTVPPILEMLVQDGSFATHISSDDPSGCAGWHVIHGPIFAFGRGSAPKTLQSWLLSTPLLPSLGPMVASSFKRPMLNGVKLLFGYGQEDIAEVRVNGMIHDAASRRLRLMNWPRASEVAFARCYWLFVHNRESNLSQIIP